MYIIAGHISVLNKGVHYSPAVCSQGVIHCAPFSLWLAQSGAVPWQLAGGHFCLLVHPPSLSHFLPVSLELLIFVHTMQKSVVVRGHCVTEFKKKKNLFCPVQFGFECVSELF